MNAPEQAAPQPPSGEISYWLRVIVGIPLSLLGGLVTLLLGIILCAYIVDRIGGGRPVPELIHFLVLWLVFGAGPLATGILLLRAKAASKRFWYCILAGVLFLFLAVGVDGNFGPTNWHALFRQEKLPGTDAASLKQTIVSPHLEAEITKGTNVLWCGTFQLAWNEACDLTGGDLQFDRDHPMFALLNKHAFTKDSIDGSSYVAMAGFVKDDIHEKIQRAVNEQFNSSFKPRFVPDKKLTRRPQDFVAYACLHKHLSFSVPFERLDESLPFAGDQVLAFGIGPHKAAQDSMYPQVLILDYQSEDDFVIELRTKSEGDRLILAKVQPKGTLGDTVTSVRERTTQTNVESALTNDLLIVPRMKLDLTREYSEIEGLLLVPQGTNIAKDLMLRSAVQNTQFELSEKGVELRSEAHMAFGCGKQKEPVPNHKMVFNKPFLVLLERTGAKMPYFAVWVDNSELLIR
jgi:hypothetical protein